MIYNYPARTAATTNAKLLRQEIAALALPGWTDFTRDASGLLQIAFPSDLSPANKSALDAVIANHDYMQRTLEQQAAFDQAQALMVSGLKASCSLSFFLS